MADGTVLVKVRAHYNGNMHLFFNAEFMLKLNVEYGRLKGWLPTANDAAIEMEDMNAAAAWNSTFKLGADPSRLLSA